MICTMESYVKWFCTAIISKLTAFTQKSKTQQWRHPTGKMQQTKKSDSIKYGE